MKFKVTAISRINEGFTAGLMQISESLFFISADKAK
jgi:hypothetical protein